MIRFYTLLTQCRPSTPDALGVFVNLPHAVKRDPQELTVGIDDLKRLGAFRWKDQFLECNQDYPVFSPVIISQLKPPLAELRSPPDAVEEFLDWNHFRDNYYCRSRKALI